MLRRDHSLRLKRTSAYTAFLTHLKQQSIFASADSVESRAHKLRLAGRMWKRLTPAERRGFEMQQHANLAISNRALLKRARAGRATDKPGNREDDTAGAQLTTLGFNNFNILMHVLSARPNALADALPNTFLMKIAKETVKLMKPEEVEAMRRKFETDSRATGAVARENAAANAAVLGDDSGALSALESSVSLVAADAAASAEARTAAHFVLRVIRHGRASSGAVIRPRPVHELIVPLPETTAPTSVEGGSISTFADALRTVVPRVEVRNTRGGTAATTADAVFDGSKFGIEEPGAQLLLDGGCTGVILQLALKSAPTYFDGRPWLALTEAEIWDLCVSWATSLLAFIQLMNRSGRMPDIVRRQGLTAAATRLFLDEFCSGLSHQQRHACNIFVRSPTARCVAAVAFEDFCGASAFVSEPQLRDCLPIVELLASFVGVDSLSRQLPSCHPHHPEVLPPTAVYTPATSLTAENAQFWRLLLYHCPAVAHLAPMQRAQFLLDADGSCTWARELQRPLTWFAASCYYSKGVPVASRETYDMSHLAEEQLEQLVAQAVDNNVLPGLSVFEKTVALSKPFMTAPQRAYHVRREVYDLGTEARPAPISDIASFYIQGPSSFWESKCVQPVREILLESLSAALCPPPPPPPPPADPSELSVAAHKAVGRKKRSAAVTAKTAKASGRIRRSSTGAKKNKKVFLKRGKKQGKRQKKPQAKGKALLKRKTARGAKRKKEANSRMKKGK